MHICKACSRIEIRNGTEYGCRLYLSEEELASWSHFYVPVEPVTDKPGRIESSQNSGRNSQITKDRGKEEEVYKFGNIYSYTV